MVAKIVRLVIIVHVAMETTKKSNFTCQSKSFISIFVTCQVSACELQSFSYHDLANDIKVGFKEKIRFFNLFLKSDNKLFDPSNLTCNSIVNKFTVCMKSVFIFQWMYRSDRCIFRYKSMESVKSR